MPFPPPAPLLQRFIDDALTSADALIERTLAGTLHRLSDGRSAAGPGTTHGPPLSAALRRHAGAFKSAFIASLRADVQRHLQASAAPAHADSRAPRSAGGLELMDESRVEVDIEISKARQAIETAAEWELRELQTFTSTLTGQTHVSPESNPLPPQAYAAALWQAACAVAPSQADRATLLQLSASVAAGLLKSAFAAASTRLESQGVEPGIYRTIVLAPSLGRAKAAETVGEAVGELGGLLTSVRPVADGTAAPASADGSTGAATAPTAEPAMSVERSHRGRSGAGEARAPARTPPAVDRRVIELVSRVFETLLADTRLHPAFRPVVARLQGSALRVALTEPAGVERLTHPVWALLNRLGAASAAFPSHADPRGAALLTFCTALAEELAGASDPDAALFRHGLARLDAFSTEQWQGQLHAAAATTEALTRIEAREVLEQQLAQRLTDDMAALHLGPAMRRFVGGTWARVLAEALLRFGETHATTTACMQAVDDLLWTFRLPDHPQSRQRLVGLLPGLLQRLRDGMALIDLPAAERQAVLDELMAIHAGALRPGARTAAGDAAPGARSSADDALRGGRTAAGAGRPAHDLDGLRSAVDPAEAGATSPGGHPLIDLASLQTVPAALLPEHTPDAAAAAGRIDALAPGARCRLFVNGRWEHTQLLWRSPRGRLLLLAGEEASRPHSVTRRALERLDEAGLARWQADTPLVQRAVDRLARRLESPPG